MTVRAWWDNARESDQGSVLGRLGLDRGLTGIPWFFLPKEVQCILTRRVRIHDEQLDPEWRRR
jgi:hypothetical protein